MRDKVEEKMNSKIDPKEAIKRIEGYLKKVGELLEKSYKEGREEKQQLNTVIKGFLRAAFKDDDKKIADYKKSVPFWVKVGGIEDTEEEKQQFYLDHLRGIKNHLLAFKEELNLIISSTKKTSQIDKKIYKTKNIELEMVKKPNEIFKLDSTFGLILSIILAVSISKLFEQFSSYEVGSLGIWIVLSVLLYSISVLLIYYLVSHKSIDNFSFALKISVLYLLVFFPYFLEKTQNLLFIEIYLSITGGVFAFWGLYESIKRKNKLKEEPRFWIGIATIAFMLLLIFKVLK